MAEPTERPPVDWGAVRADYEDRTVMVKAICASYCTTVSALYWRKNKEHWTPRRATRSADRQAIIGRMFRLLLRQVKHLEGRDVKETGEKEVAVLGKLASTLEKLIDIDDAAAEPPKPAVQQRDMKELRHRLAIRIAQLKSG